MYEWWYVPLLGFVLGIFTRSLVVIDDAVLGVGLVLATALFLLGTRARDEGGFIVRLAAVFLVCLVLGALRLNYAEEQFASSTLTQNIGEEVEIIGVVAREPDQRALQTQLYVRQEDELILVSTDRFTQVSYGDRISVQGKLTKPESFETELGRTFDYPGYLKARGVQHQISFAEVTVLEEASWSIVGFLLTMKYAFMSGLEQIMPEPQAGLGEGLLLGVKRALGDDLETIFRTTGIIHIVVLSGYNIMLVVAFVLYVLSWVLPLRPRMIVGVFAIVAFALLVGLSATVVRASIMAGLLLLAQFLGRTYAVVRALCIAGVMMLLINPYLLVFDVGFQLSFIATLGLILGVPVVEARLGEHTWWGLRTFFVATVATQIFVTPLLLYQIGELSLVAIVVNMLVLPMVPVAMLLTFVAGVLSLLITPAALLCAQVAYWALTYIIVIPTFFSHIPLASVVVPIFPWWALVLGYVSIGGLVWYSYRWSGSVKTLDGWVVEDEMREQYKEISPEKNNDVRLPHIPPVSEPPVFFR